MNKWLGLPCIHLFSQWPFIGDGVGSLHSAFLTFGPMIGQHDLLPGPYSVGHPPVAALNIAPANVFEPNDFFCAVHGAFNCSWTFLVHYPQVLDPPEPQR
jgi:hypothetical protein